MDDEWLPLNALLPYTEASSGWRCPYRSFCRVSFCPFVFSIVDNNSINQIVLSSYNHIKCVTRHKKNQMYTDFTFCKKKI